MASAVVRSGKAGLRRAVRWTAAGSVLCGLALAGWLYGGVAAEAFRGVRQGLERAVAGVQAAAGALPGLAAPDFILAHPYFAVREVKVLGAERVKGADIVVMSGLGPDTRIWSIDPTEVEARVRQHPWIRSVLIQRELPARLVITIEEWSPAAIVALDKLYYVTGDGVIFKALEEEDSVEFPFVTGLRAAQLALEEPATREKLSQAVTLGQAVERTALDLSEIRFEPGGGLVLYPVSYAVPFRMGWGDWDEKLHRLRWFLREFQEHGARFRAVDLSFRGQVVARPRGEA